jgi:hypothetical protein
MYFVQHSLRIQMPMSMKGHKADIGDRLGITQGTRRKLGKNIIYLASNPRRTRPSSRSSCFRVLWSMIGMANMTFLDGPIPEDGGKGSWALWVLFSLLLLLLSLFLFSMGSELLHNTHIVQVENHIDLKNKQTFFY